MAIRFYALAIALIAVAAGCGRSAPSDAQEHVDDPGGQAEAQRILREMDRAAMEQAFERLGAYSYTRSIESRQLDEDGRQIARLHRIVRFTSLDGERRSEVLRQERENSFDFGILRRFTDEVPDPGDPPELMPQILADEPAFLQPRNFEAYDYRIEGDTLIGNRQVRVIGVHLRPEAADQHRIRMARHYIDDANRLVALEVNRGSGGLLLREDSSIRLDLQEVAGELLPSFSRATTTVGVGWSENRTFSSTSRYREISSGPALAGRR
jgi:hypothetical protein